jgi:hypothetical protein
LSIVSIAEKFAIRSVGLLAKGAVRADAVILWMTTSGAM